MKGALFGYRVGLRGSETIRFHGGAADGLTEVFHLHVGFALPSMLTRRGCVYSRVGASDFEFYRVESKRRHR